MFHTTICLDWCVENCALMVLIVLMNNVAKSSAVRIDEGGGGQRREVKDHATVRIGNFVVIVCPFSSGDISREGREEWLIHIKVSRIFWFAPHSFNSPELRAMFAENIRQPTSRAQHSNLCSCFVFKTFLFFTYFTCIVHFFSASINMVCSFPGSVKALPLKYTMGSDWLAGPVCD